MPDHITVNVAQITAIIAAIGALGGAIRWLVPRLRKFGHLLDALVGVPEDGRPSIVAKVDAALVGVEEIRRQVYSNGGESLRDQVDKVRTQVTELGAAQQDQAGALASLAAGSDQKAAAIDDLRERFGAIEKQLTQIHADNPGGTP